MLRRAAVALCAAAALSGCMTGGSGTGGTTGHSEPALHHLSPAGVAWLVKWHRWSEHADEAPSAALDAPPAGAAVSCTRLRSRVGPPVDRRLDEVWATARQECASIQHLAQTSDRDGRLSVAELHTVNRIHDMADRSLKQVDRLLVIGQMPRVSTEAADATRIDPRFGRAADHIVKWGDITGGVAPQHISVRCYGEGDWAPLTAEQRIFYPKFSVDDTIAFVVTQMPRTMFLSPSVCAGLGRLERGERPTDEGSLLELGTAVNALAHESVHLTGVTDEAVTECRSVQLIVETAKSLGVDADYAARMRDAYWDGAYPRLSAAYRTSACRDGSELDLDSTRHAFP
jgi:hypothetical protein